MFEVVSGMYFMRALRLASISWSVWRNYQTIKTKSKERMGMEEGEKRGV